MLTTSSKIESNTQQSGVFSWLSTTVSQLTSIAINSDANPQAKTTGYMESFFNTVSILTRGVEQKNICQKIFESSEFSPTDFLTERDGKSLLEFRKSFTISGIMSGEKARSNGVYDLLAWYLICLSNADFDQTNIINKFFCQQIAKDDLVNEIGFRRAIAEARQETCFYEDLKTITKCIIKELFNNIWFTARLFGDATSKDPVESKTQEITSNFISEEGRIIQIEIEIYLLRALLKIKDQEALKTVLSAFDNLPEFPIRFAIECLPHYSLQDINDYPKTKTFSNFIAGYFIIHNPNNVLKFIENLLIGEPEEKIEYIKERLLEGWKR